MRRSAYSSVTTNVLVDLLSVLMGCNHITALLILTSASIFLLLACILGLLSDQ